MYYLTSTVVKGVTMEFKNHIPIYLQIVTKIKKDIVLNIRKAGDKLPSVREYALTLKVNPNTVQKAYAELERLELVYSQRGIGRFICDQDGMKDHLMFELSSGYVERFIKQMKDVGYNHKEIIERVEQQLEMEG